MLSSMFSEFRKRVTSHSLACRLLPHASRLPNWTVGDNWPGVDYKAIEPLNCRQAADALNGHRGVRPQRIDGMARSNPALASAATLYM